MKRRSNEKEGLGRIVGLSFAAFIPGVAILLILENSNCKIFKVFYVWVSCVQQIRGQPWEGGFLLGGLDPAHISSPTCECALA